MANEEGLRPGDLVRLTPSQLMVDEVERVTAALTRAQALEAIMAMDTLFQVTAGFDNLKGTFRDFLPSSTRPPEMTKFARIGAPTNRSGPILTDEPRVIRRVGYAVWRYITNADPKQVGAKYVMEFPNETDFHLYPTACHADWTWYQSQGYSTLQECLAHALKDWREDLYVYVQPINLSLAADEEYLPLANVSPDNNPSRYASEYGVNLTAAVSSIVADLADFGAIICFDHGPQMIDRQRWGYEPLGLDAWVAGCLLQIPDVEDRLR